MSERRWESRGCPECGSDIVLDRGHAGKRFCCHNGHRFSALKTTLVVPEAEFAALRSVSEEVAAYMELAVARIADGQEISREWTTNRLVRWSAALRAVLGREDRDGE